MMNEIIADDYAEALDGVVRGGGEFDVCPYCGNLLIMPGVRLVCAGDSEGPPVYEPVVQTIRCDRCGSEVMV